MSAPQPVRARIAEDAQSLVLTWSDGLEETLPAAWLGDNAEGAFDPRTGQRRQSLSALSFEAELHCATLDADGLTVVADPGQSWLISHRRMLTRRASPPPRELWLAPQRIAALPPIAADAFLTNDHALAEACLRVARDGLALLAGGQPVDGYVAKIVARFGFIRETNYGRLFDVKSEAQPSNLAFTAQALDLHTDNPYRDPTPTLQLLHAIRADATGGATCFIDGFAHAQAFADERPEAFARLAGQPVEFAYTAPDASVLRARQPLIEQGPDGALKAIRLNHRSLQAVDLPGEALGPWYAAYRAFHERLHAPAAALKIVLQPGEVVIFDNRRLLHGRDAFDGEQTAGRWLQGCYADIDGLLATLARLQASAAA